MNGMTNQSTKKAASVPKNISDNNDSNVQKVYTNVWDSVGVVGVCLVVLVQSILV